MSRRNPAHTLGRAHVPKTVLRGHRTAPKSVEIPLAPKRRGREARPRTRTHDRSRTSWGSTMPDMTADDLKDHLKLIQAATTEDLDELLHDLLVRVYPSKKTQDS